MSKVTGGGMGSALASAALHQVVKVLQFGSDALADGVRTARFLAEQRRFEVRADDVFISSYPRSGTTLLQYMVHLLVHDGDSGFDHISDVAPWFERDLSLGRKTAEDLHAMPSPRVFKSHLPFSFVPKGGRLIYVERDGRDVVLSYFHLYRSHLGYRGDFSQFFERFLTGELQYRSWFKHVAAYRKHRARSDLHRVVYEALTADLAREMTRIAEFLGLARSPTRIAELAELCRFEAMKAQESRFDHATGEAAVRRQVPGGFIRKGQTGGGMHALSSRQLAQFEAHLARPQGRVDSELRLPSFLH